jgi:glutamate synthase (NADPH/NADH) large chain
VNPDSVIWQRIDSAWWNDLLLSLIEEHVAETGSRHARRILAQWETERQRFWQVCPKEMVNRLKQPLSDSKASAIA